MAMTGDDLARIIELAAARFAIESRVLAGDRRAEASLQRVQAEVAGVIAALAPLDLHALATLHFYGSGTATFVASQERADDLMRQRGARAIDHLASVALHLSLPAAQTRLPATSLRVA